MAKNINFEVENFEVIEENPDSQFATAKIQAFSSSVNRHDMVCSEETLVKTAPTLYNKPILYNIDRTYDDFGSHTVAEKSLIAGFVVPDSAEFVKMPDQRVSLNVIAKIWKRYAPKAIELFKAHSGNKKVSVEMEMFEAEKRADGLVDMIDFAYSGICILGDFITEASPGANIQVLSFAKEEEAYKKAYELEFGKYDSIDFNIPEAVRNNATEGLRLYKKHNRGGNSVAVSLARHLSTGKKSNPDKVRYISKAFSGTRFDKIDKELPSNSYIGFMLYGGIEAKEWSKNISIKLEDIDAADLRFFGDTVTFPYTSLDEANPALKGIDPPVSLEQANAIAKQADAIGSDDEKNGWAIAISNFKKSHIVKDNKWVKKEKNMVKNDKKVVEGDKIPVQDDATITANFDDAVVTEPVAVVEPAVVEPVADVEPVVEPAVVEPAVDAEPVVEPDVVEPAVDATMSLDANLDVKAVMEFLANETEEFQKMVSEEFAKPAKEINYAMLCKMFYAKMCDMAKDMEAYMAENAELKEFKAGVEKAEFEFAVDAALKELESVVNIPSKELSEMKERSSEFNMSTIDAWKNECKAKAFEFSLKENKGDKSKTKKMSLPWMETDDNRQSVWEKLIK